VNAITCQIFPVLASFAKTNLFIYDLPDLRESSLASFGANLENLARLVWVG
jgi:hypothetical protein